MRYKTQTYYLEYNSTIACSSTGISISSRLGNLVTEPLRFWISAVSQAGTFKAFLLSAISLNNAVPRLFSLTPITSPTLIKAEGMSRRLPLTVM